MEDKITNIKERVLQIAELKGVSKEKFFENIGMTYGNFKGKSKETPLNSNAIVDILSIYNDINPVWLLNGKGDPILSEETATTFSEKSAANYVSEPESTYTTRKIGKPLIPLDALAGNGNGGFTIMDHDIKEHYSVPEFNHADFMIKVSGASMQPKYYGGDVVACKIIRDLSFFQWNRVYVLDTDQGAIIKRVKQGSDDDHLLLVSENKNYEPFEIAKQDLNALALVLGVIRLE